MKINKKKYAAVKKENYFVSDTTKKQILIANSLRKDNFHINRWKNKSLGVNKDWSTYTITREGNIYEHYPPKKYSEFIGDKKIDKKIISIVLENMGFLTKVNGKYYNWLNEECVEEKVGENKFLGYQYWEIFPEKQIETLIELINSLCDKLNISKNVIDFKNYHKNMVNFKGIVFRSNYVYETNDINPLFPIDDINKVLNKELI